MSGPEKPNELSEAALALDRELRRFEDLAAQAGHLKLDTEKALDRATEALTRAAESQDLIHGHVRHLVEAVASARQKQEDDARALIARAGEIAARRKEFAEVLQRMAGLGLMAKEVQQALQAGPASFDQVQSRMQAIADEAAGIARIALEKQMEDVLRQAEALKVQVLAAKDRIALLAAKKPGVS